MNEEEYRHALVNRLRGITYGWIQALRQSATLGIPYANYPFPEGFPFSEKSISATFDWNEFYGDELHHGFPVSLEFIRTSKIPLDPEDPTTRLIWQTVSLNDAAILGYVEVDSRMFFDRQPLVSLDRNLILEAMLISLQRGCFLELSSTIIPEEDGPKNYHLPLLDRRNIEIFEIRTLERDLVMELGRRWIPKRQCEDCGGWIPPTGLPFCQKHIFDRAEQIRA